MTEVQTELDNKNLTSREEEYATEKIHHIQYKHINIFKDVIDYDSNLCMIINKPFKKWRWINGFINDFKELGISDLESIYYYLRQIVEYSNLPISDSYIRTQLKKRLNTNKKFPVNSYYKHWTTTIDYGVLRQNFIKSIESGECYIKDNRVKFLKNDLEVTHFISNL